MPILPCTGWRIFDTSSVGVHAGSLAAMATLAETQMIVQACRDLLRAATEAAWSREISTREGRASLDTTGLHTGLCRPAVEWVPSLQEHELRCQPSDV